MQYHLFYPWHRSLSHLRVYGFYFFRLYSLFCFPRSSTSIVPASRFTLLNVPSKGPIIVILSLSSASANVHAHVATYAGRINWAPSRCSLRYTTSTIFLTDHLVQLKISKGTVPLTFSTGAKTVTVDAIADIHRISIYTKSNDCPRNAFRKVILWHWLYTTEQLPTTLLARQTKFRPLILAASVLF